jgi:EAL domain-containing protein (putative c-di-GMP-specific phosphodiesterase class I)
VYPHQLLSVARGADLLFQLDLAARRTAIRDVVRHGITTKLFINFTPSGDLRPNVLFAQHGANAPRSTDRA